MAYDDSRFRGEPGFRDEPDFRAGGVPEDAPTFGANGPSMYTPGSYPVDDYDALPTESTTPVHARRPLSAAQLNDVFDDPEHGEPGRDRMAVHALWEMALLLGAAALVYLLRTAEPAALRGDQLRDLMLVGAEIGLVTIGMGLSLRAGAPNLAVGPLVYASALFFADNSDRGLAVTAGITALVGLGVGLAIAILVGAFHVPAWAASLGVALGLMVWIADQRPVSVVNGAYDPQPHALVWLLGAVGLAVFGGLLGLVKSVRRTVGRFRPVADPARRRGGGAAVLASLALLSSSLLASVAGVLIALDTRELGPTENGFALTGLALGAALLGGTSAFGRRGGVLGTVLAVALIVLLVRYAAAERWDLSPLAVAAFAIFSGLVVTRLVETFGRPRVVPEPEEDPDAAWAPPPPAVPDNGWSATRTGGWTSQLPARTTDEGWGVEERWGTR